MYLEDEEKFRQMLGGTKITLTIARTSTKAREYRNIEIIKLHAAGETIHALAARFDLSLSTIIRTIQKNRY